MAKIETPALPDLDPRGLSKRGFSEEYQRLLRAFANDSGNTNSYACERCERCTGCMFCKGCQDCYRCNHCTDCKDCSECTHCSTCESCHGCSYSVQSKLCTGSAYLLLCQNCSDCTYCFGCVGLSKKDFHILNRPYDRKTFFEAMKRLRAELELA